MDNLVRLASTRVWSIDDHLVNALFRVFCALIVAGHDTNPLFASVPELMDAFMGDPVTLLGAVTTNYATLQLLIDTGAYLQNDWVFNFVRDTWDRLNDERAPDASNFRGSDEFWRRVFRVSLKIVKYQGEHYFTSLYNKSYFVPFSAVGR